MRTCPACHNVQWRTPHNCTDGPPLTHVAVMGDGSRRTLTREERQYVEPSAYCHEAGWWCVADEDDRLYFVSDDGRVDLHDADTFACLQESAGVLRDVHDAYWREQAETAEARRRAQ